ncbi:MAG: adenosine deaminase [Candidatus Weimeria sp.]
MDKARLKAMPKAELHCHLDGSLSPEFISSRLGRKVDKTELSVSMDCASLNEYLEKFDLPIRVLSTREAVRDGVVDVMRQAAAENVRYIEIRYDPVCLSEAARTQASTGDHIADEKSTQASAGDHMAEEGSTQASAGDHDTGREAASCHSEKNESRPDKYMSPEDAVQASIEGLRCGEEKYGIRGSLILCAMRHFDLEKNLGTLALVKKYLGKGVCALDLAGAEALYPTAGFKELFAAAEKMNVPFVIHAGEAAGPESVRAALDFGASRIGHGIAVSGQSDLKQYLSENQTALEMCPTSNFQTKAVKDSYPLREFLDAGLAVTINTDNRTVSDTTLTDDLELATSLAHLSDRELVTIEKTAVKASFADEATKQKILEELEKFSEEL